MMDQFRTIALFLASETAEHGAEAAEHSAHHGPGFWGLMIYLGLVIAIMVGTMAVAKKGLNSRFFTNRVTQLYEQLFLFLENLAVGIIGPHGRKYIPMLTVFWVVIFLSNVVSLFMPTAPTAVLSFNLAMALIAVGYVQWEGMRTNGVFGHFSHFAGPKLPLLMALFISTMIFVIELISEAMKNVSLSLRLYGNIHGGHQAVTAMNQLGEPVYIPFGAFLLPIKVLTCIVQALIFCLLTCVYISLVTAHHDDHEGAAAH